MYSWEIGKILGFRPPVLIACISTSTPNCTSNHGVSLLAKSSVHHEEPEPSLAEWGGLLLVLLLAENNWSDTRYTVPSINSSSQPTAMTKCYHFTVSAVIMHGNVLLRFALLIQPMTVAKTAKTEYKFIFTTWIVQFRITDTLYGPKL